MNRDVSRQLTDDLHALERFLRGSHPGYGRSFASLLLQSLQSTSCGQKALTGCIDALARSVHAYVNDDATHPLRGNAMELWSRVEHAIAGCRASLRTLEAGHLASGAVLAAHAVVQ
jgi:hypothetical protein